MKSRSLVLICCGFLLGASSLLAQDTTNCDCKSVFDQLTKKLESDYIGYALRKEEIGEAYRKRISEFHMMTNDTSALSCAATLQKFLTFFHDGHLFVSQFPKYSTGEKEAFKASLRNRLYDVSSVEAYLSGNSKPVAAIEGVWTDGTTRYAIMRNGDNRWPYQYVAVVLESPDSEKVGELKLGVNLTDGKYAGVYYSNDYSPRYMELDPAKDNTLLGLWGGLLWGRVNYSDRSGIMSAALYDPTRPTVNRIDSISMLLTIPTFLVDKAVFDSVLIANQQDLTSCKYLIIDIRGNSGGNAIYFDLMSLYAERPLTSEIGFALASDDNIAYFSRYATDAPDDPYRPVVIDMKTGTRQDCQRTAIHRFRASDLPFQCTKGRYPYR